MLNFDFTYPYVWWVTQSYVVLCYKKIVCWLFLENIVYVTFEWFKYLLVCSHFWRLKRLLVFCIKMNKTPLFSEKKFVLNSHGKKLIWWAKIDFKCGGWIIDSDKAYAKPSIVRETDECIFIHCSFNPKFIIGNCLRKTSNI